MNAVPNMTVHGLAYWILASLSIAFIVIFVSLLVYTWFRAIGDKRKENRKHATSRQTKRD